MRYNDHYPLTPKRIERLKEVREYVQNIESCITDIIAGTTETKACVSHGINKQSFRHMLFRDHLGWADTKRTNIDIDSYMLSPSEQIYKEIFSCPTDEIPVDTDETVLYVMKKYLNQKEQHILKLKYWGEFNQNEIAKKMNMSPARIGQLKRKAFRKLSCPSPKRIMEFGIEYDKLYHDVRQNIQDAKRKAMVDALMKNKDKELQAIDKSLTIMDMPIESLDLSLRPYNCLKRSGINTISKLCDITIDELMSIRNLGEKAKNEIIEKLKEQNLSLKEIEDDKENE